MDTGEGALPHLELQSLRRQLHNMLSSISNFGPTLPKPPVIDSSSDLTGQSADAVQRREPVRGMRTLKDSVKRDLDVLEKVFFVPSCPCYASSCERAAAVVSHRSRVRSSPGLVHQRAVSHICLERSVMCATACHRDLEHVFGNWEDTPSP